MLARCALLTIAAIVLVVGPATAASRPAVLGLEDGVQATAAAGTLEIRFTGAAAGLGRKLAGKSVELFCDVHPKPGLLFADEPTQVKGASGKVDAGGTILRVKLANPGDACELLLADSFRALARVALTPAGVVWADEQKRAAELIETVFAVAPTAVHPPVAKVVAAGGGRVVALDAPDGSPPPGQLGYWTDGGARAAYVTLSGEGRRLFVQDLGSGVQRTNVFDAELNGAPARRPEIDGSLQQSDRDRRGVREYRRKAVVAADGVRVAITGGRIVVRFTGRSAAAFRAIAGHRVLVICRAVPPTDLLGSVVVGPALSARVVRVPRHGGVLALRTPRAHDDCMITDGGSPVTEVWPTVLGRRFGSTITAALSFVSGMPSSLATRGATSYPGAATIVAQHQDMVVMATPGAPVRRGKVGVWTDAAQRAVVATTAPGGRRLFIADEGDGVMRSNATSALVSFFTALGI